MNKKGQSLIFGVMLIMLGLILATIMAQPVRELVEINRDADHLNCTSDALTTGVISTCLILDLMLPYFVGAVLFLSGGYLVVKRIKGL